MFTTGCLEFLTAASKIEEKSELSPANTRSLSSSSSETFGKLKAKIYYCKLCEFKSRKFGGLKKHEALIHNKTRINEKRE